MSEKLEELISLLYQDKLTQYGKRLLVENIEKLQKENEELKSKNKTLEENCKKCIIRDELDEYVNNSISVQTIKAKIEELDIEISTCEYADDDSEEYKQEVEKDKAELLRAKKVLQQLLESEEEK